MFSDHIPLYYVRAARGFSRTLWYLDMSDDELTFYYRNNMQILKDYLKDIGAPDVN